MEIGEIEDSKVSRPGANRLGTSAYRRVNLGRPWRRQIRWFDWEDGGWIRRD